MSSPEHADRHGPDGGVQPPPTGAVLRFVVLHHTGVAAPHFDLLLEIPGAARLMTWRVPTPPWEWHAGDIAAQRAADHRRLYLDFEGSISGGRGSVTRAAWGQAVVESCSAASLRLRLTGELPQACLTTTVRLPLRCGAGVANATDGG